MRKNPAWSSIRIISGISPVFFPGISLVEKFRKWLRQTVSVCLLLCMSVPGTVMALSLDVRSSNRNWLDFSLVFENASLDLTDDDNSIQTDFNRIGITVYDVPDSKMHVGLMLGYAFVDHPDQAAAQGLEMDGGYLGIIFRGMLMQGDSLDLTLLFHYLYQGTNASDEDGRLSLNWNEFNLEMRAGIKINPSLRVIAGATYGIIEAKQRLRGTVNQTLTLENDRDAGVSAGADYLLNDREYIGFHFNSGAVDGVQIIFQRLF